MKEFGTLPQEKNAWGFLLETIFGRRSQDGGGIGRVITFSSTNSLKEQQNGEQSLQSNFWSLAADIRRPEKQPIVFEGREDKGTEDRKGRQGNEGRRPVPGRESY